MDLGEADSVETKGPTRNKRKAAREDEDDGDCQPDTDTDTEPEDLDDNSNIASSSWLEGDTHEGPMRGTSLPKARPLRDPL